MTLNICRALTLISGLYGRDFVAEPTAAASLSDWKSTVGVNSFLVNVIRSPIRIVLKWKYCEIGGFAFWRGLVRIFYFILLMYKTGTVHINQHFSFHINPNERIMCVHIHTHIYIYIYAQAGLLVNWIKYCWSNEKIWISLSFPLLSSSS